MASLLPFRLLFSILDFFIAFFLVLPSRGKIFKSRLENERDIYVKDAQTEPAKLAMYVEHYSKLLQINHQRVSASISHVSIMGAILMYSTKSVFPEHSWSLAIVEAELCIYLFIIVALLRCLRDYGLDGDFSASAYVDGMLNELSFRYGILRACNLTLITGTLVFLLVFALHFL